MTSPGNLHIGTSGWHYAHWRQLYYPPDLPPDEWLGWYAREFDCVEVNNSFYRLPQANTIASWRDATPPGFQFAVKASRLITHLKKLRQCDQALHTFLTRMTHFGGKLGPILFQLPPRWHVNTERLEAFVRLLPGQLRYSFEFRDPSWHCPAVYRILEANDIAFCLYELAGRTSPEVVTSTLLYIRLHGPSEKAYCGSYTREALQEWADKIRHWRDQGRDVYVFFDNDQSAYAPRNAETLKHLSHAW